MELLRWYACVRYEWNTARFAECELDEGMLGCVLQEGDISIICTEETTTKQLNMHTKMIGRKIVC